MEPKVLITDGNERAALAATRSLGKSGFQIEICTYEGPSLSGASKYCLMEHRVPSPLAAPTAFTDRILEVCLDRAIDVLLPITDAALLALLPRRQEFSPTRIPFPSFESYSRVSAKDALMTTARDLGLYTPGQVVLAEPPAKPLASADLPDFPLVIKPARSVFDSDSDGVRRQTGVTYVSDEVELGNALERYPAGAYPLLLQERIPGAGFGVFLLLWEGKLLATFAHRRLREKPPTGGVSVYREAIALDPDLLDLSRKLLESHDWSGVAMVEFKRSTRDGRPYLMEVNGRFWGSLQLAIDAGVDFPTLLVRSALGEAVSPVSSYRVGTRSRWFLGDLDHLLLRLRRKYRPPELPPGSGGLLRALVRFATPWAPGARFEVLRISDPGPGIREWKQWVGGILR